MRTMADRPPDSDGPLRSLFANDPEMKGLVEHFLAELHRRADAVRNAMADKDLDELRLLAHQIRGSAGGFGYPVLGVAAAALEQAIVAEMCNEACLKQRVDELLALCDRASKSSS